jgi:hypothetical protein
MYLILERTVLNALLTCRVDCISPYEGLNGTCLCTCSQWRIQEFGLWGIMASALNTSLQGSGEGAPSAQWGPGTKPLGVGQVAKPLEADAFYSQTHELCTFEAP